jgi:aspartate dehydrogenase
VKVGIIGCGSIGTIICKAVGEGKAGEAEISALYDTDSLALEKLSKLTGAPPASSIDELVKKSDLVVECASQAAVREYGEKIAGKKDFMVLSVGALLEGKLREALIQKAKAGKRKVYAPSGAVCGLDGLRGAGMGKLGFVSLTSTKPPAGFGLPKDSPRQVMFSGIPEDAVKKFPANVNVSAAVKLSSGGSEVKVTVIADPEVKLNTHEIVAQGDFGKLTCKSENMPSENPKTSALAALSAVAMIKRMTETLIVG